MVSLKRKFESFGALAVVLLLSGWMREALALRPLRERGPASSMSWGDERLFLRRDGNDPNPYSRWNITGTYRGRWSFSGMSNGTSRFLDFGKSNGMSVLELMSTPTKINGVHYVQGAAIFHDVHDKEHDLGVAQMRLEGVYIWPFKQLRLVATSGNDGDLLQEEHFMSNPYHLLGAFSSQVFQESPRERMRRRRTHTNGMEKHCNVEIAAQVTRLSSSQADGEHDCFHLEGLMESPAVEDDGECFSPIMLNVTSLNVEVYYNKAVNYTLMVTFISFFQVLLLIRQMEHSNTQSGAAKVSILMIGQQAIMDAYLCLLHLTAGILVESLFNAFMTAAFFKFDLYFLYLR
ncbi:hypothetical protein HPP92_012418 [Vanilla planifolia]|uniref:RING-type E3 ubiquitin transferase n=1 Tax=Vanilla planifolia TaxID=51239 RepID=A0A835R4W5_VANPL|nr:hypothetical protein HPP92_012418 [Vanilla planifolia]